MIFEKTQVFLASTGTRSLYRNPPVVSVKEAMLHIAWLASNGGPGNAYYPTRIGDPLVHVVNPYSSTQAPRSGRSTASPAYTCGYSCGHVS
ncbi:hypothetical protein DTO195F2_4833 [Paecilomyces variotii]|nr:hypothetical protein DTO195F2_4833 [Paecilomyces variotii]KAJ9370919.1 hypothetical protein DTO282E5_4448 [Paecilomyces variotii]